MVQQRIVIAAGNVFSIGLKTGSVFCGTGENIGGQLNTGNTTSISSYSCSTISGLRLSDNYSAVDESMIQINGLQVFPNPNAGSFTIASNIEDQYSIINELGQTLQSIDLNVSNNYTMQINGLNNGLYSIVGSDKTQQQRIVVIK